MSKKTERKGKLRYSLLLLLLLAILLISSTYAWFTANTTVEVSELQVNVQAQNGLQISANATEWKSILSNTDITNAAYEGCINQVPATMEALSTAGNVTAGDLDMFYGEVNPDDEGDYALTAQAEPIATKGTNGRYIAFDVYMRVDSNSDLKLTSASYVNSTTNKGLQNASRVAFLVQGHVGLEEEATSLYDDKNGTASELYIWEPNYDTHTAAAVQNAFNTYGTSINTTDVQQPYDGVSAAIADPIKLREANATANSGNFATVTPKISTTTVFDEDQPMFNLQAGVTKVRVYMWVEGQDLDCENNASGSDVQYSLQFTIGEDEP